MALNTIARKPEHDKAIGPGELDRQSGLCGGIPALNHWAGIAIVRG
jgi:hypothetical protein